MDNLDINLFLSLPPELQEEIIIQNPELTRSFSQLNKPYAKSMSRHYYNQFCNQPLSIHEIKKVMTNHQLQKNDVFYFYKPDELNKIVLKTFEYLKYSPDNVYVKPSEAISTNESYTVRGLIGYRRSMNDISENFNYHLDILFISMDVRGLFYAYNNRSSCLTKDYAKQKTLEEFNRIVQYLIDENQFVQLNLYLLRNAIILGIAKLSDINQIMKSPKTYDDYIESTEIFRNDKINQINDVINNM
jgi:hypothetical protein